MMTFVKTNSTRMIHRKLSFVAIIWPIVIILVFISHDPSTLKT